MTRRDYMQFFATILVLSAIAIGNWTVFEAEATYSAPFGMGR